MPEKKIRPARRTAGKSSTVLALDLGGTKIRIATVSTEGKITEENEVATQTQQGPNGLIDQVVALCVPYLKKNPRIRSIGIASAGPLDPVKGVLLDPTNLTTGGAHWGVVPLKQKIEAKLKRSFQKNISVTVENDAAAAVLAEKWKGCLRQKQNGIILTLGTGLGTGMLVNGQLVRAGRHLHPEGGHLILEPHDPLAQCGCGNQGCAEALLSGTAFVQRLQKEWKKPDLTGPELIRMIENSEPAALRYLHIYSRWMARALQNYTVLYAPEVICFTGGFAAAFPYFKDQVLAELAPLMKTRRTGVDLMPKLMLSPLKNRGTLLGGAWVALQKK